jgi:hypothetical protein
MFGNPKLEAKERKDKPFFSPTVFYRQVTASRAIIKADLS